MTHPNVRFGALVRKARLALEPPLTQEQLAAALGVSQPSVSAWEKGRCLPELPSLMALCQILNLDLPAVLAAVARGSSDEPTAAAG